MEVTLRKKKGRLNKRQKPRIYNGKMNIELGVTKYSGPATLPGYVRGSNSYLFEISYGTNIVSTSGSVISYVFSSDPSPGSLENPYTGFALLAGIFREFRILCTHYRYVPTIDGGTPTGLNPTPLAVVVERGIQAIPSSLADADHIGTVMYRSLNSVWSCTIRMEQVDEASMKSMVSGGPFAPATLFYLKLFTGAAAASTTYGRLVCKSIIQVIDPFTL